MKLSSIKKISGKIKLLTGLHIGAGDAALEIGGLDQPIIKHPLTGEPYIPGSSLKGKIRSLLEIKYKKFVLNGDKKGEPCNCGDCLICLVFGTSAAEKKAQGPTRLLVRDANLTKKWKTVFENGELPMEIKYENRINRITGTAKDPRPIERVPAGVEFDFTMNLRIFENDSEENIIKLIKQGLGLLQLDALGGCGSRGYGQILFDNLKIDGNKIENDELINVLTEKVNIELNNSGE